VIRVLGPQPLGWHGRIAQPLAFAAPLGHSQALLAPQPLRTLAVDPPSLLEQQLVRAAVAPPRPLAGDLPQLSPQRLIITGQLRLMALG
jgi:hypothetical protein